MVTAKIARIRRGLVNIDTLGERLAFELQHENRSAKQEDHIGTTGLHG